MPDEQLLTLYAGICDQLKQLEEQKKSIGEEVVKHMKGLKARKIKSSIGTFSFASRVAWKYTDEVKIAEEEVEAVKAEERENGKATSETTQYLRFQSPKITEE